MHKIRFTSTAFGNTAALVVPTEQLSSLALLSSLFPLSEARKMETLEVSPAYGSFEEAFAHEF